MILKFLKPFSFLPAIFLMYIIYAFSAQDGDTSSQLSYQVSYKIVEVGGDVLGADLQSWEIDQLATRFHTPVRKLAHMTEYFLLAVAVAFPLYVYGLRGILLLIAAGLICVGFACGDEYHQAHVAGRGPSKRDVLIDSIGVFFGIILVRIVGWTGRNTVLRPFARKKRRSAEEAAETPDSYSYAQPQAMPPQNAPGYPGRPYPQGRPNGYPPYYGQPPYPTQRANYTQPYSAQHTDYTQPYPTQHTDYTQPYPPYAQEVYYGQPDPEAYRQEDLDFYDDDVSSDRLSEDMSFRKLVSDLRDQKQARHGARKESSRRSRTDAD